MADKTLKRVVKAVVGGITDLLDLLPDDAYVRVINECKADVVIRALYTRTEDGEVVINQFSGFSFTIDCKGKTGDSEQELPTPITESELREMGYVPFWEFLNS